MTNSDINIIEKQVRNKGNRIIISLFGMLPTNLKFHTLGNQYQMRQ